jgi:hypothetical protein
MVKDHTSSSNQKCWEWYQKEGGDDLLLVFELIFKSISFVILTGCYMGRHSIWGAHLNWRQVDLFHCLCAIGLSPQKQSKECTTNPCTSTHHCICCTFYKTYSNIRKQPSMHRMNSTQMPKWPDP